MVSKMPRAKHSFKQMGENNITIAQLKNINWVYSRQVYLTICIWAIYFELKRLELLLNSSDKNNDEKQF